MPRLCFELGVFSDIQHNFIQKNRRRWHALLAVFEPSQGQQAANQFVQAAGFEFDALEHARTFRPGALPRQSQSYIQARQGRTQLMRDVIQQTRLRLYQSFQAAGHGIEIAHQSRNVVAPSAIWIPGARREVASGELLCGCSQTSHRHGHIPCEKITNQSRRQYCDDQSWNRHPAWSKEKPWSWG